MGHDNYILRDGKAEKATDLMTWAKWMQTADRTVAKTRIGEAEVSTVFLGLDHRFVPDEREPVPWETLVFGGALADEMDRYTSEADARAGHEAMVQRVKVAPKETDNGTT